MKAAGPREEPRLRSGEVLLSHNHIALLEGLASLPRGEAPSYRAWIDVSLAFISRYYWYPSRWNLLRGCHSISPTWVEKRKSGRAVECRLTKTGRNIVEGRIPAAVRGQGRYHPRPAITE